MIDLHTHTTISDGTYSPIELIQLAKKIGVSAVAITDHDSIVGLEEAQMEAERIGVNFINGIEFSVTFGNNRLLHVLGLGFDPECEGFQEIYTQYRKIRESKLTHVFDRLLEMGVSINPNDVLPFISGGYMDRQAIAKFLVAKGYASIMKEAWVKYLDKIDYIDGELIQPEDAFNAIHAGGGKAFLAHFHLNIGFKGYSEEEIRANLATLKKMGLDGLECYYPSFTIDDKLRCAKYLKEFDLLSSGGSDFHGANRPHIQLGIGEGDFCVPDQLLENIVAVPCRSF